MDDNNAPSIPPQNAKKTWKNGSEKQELFTDLKTLGYDTKKAASIVGFHPDYGRRLAARLNKCSLTSPKKVKLASSAVESALNDPDNKVRLIAAKMVYNRFEPINQPATPPPQQFVQINMVKIEEAARLIEAEKRTLGRGFTKSPQKTTVENPPN